MEEKVLNSLLERNRDRYDIVLRWISIVIVTLLTFHLFIFTPFLKIESKLLKAEEKLSILQDLEKEIGDISKKFEKLSSIAAVDLEKYSNEMYDQLKNDFEQLSELIEYIRLENKIKEIESAIEDMQNENDVKINFERITDDRDLRGIHSENIEAIQRIKTDNQRPLQETQHKATKNNFNFDENLKNKIRNAKNVEELRNILLPTIEKKIIATQFETLNQAWQTKTIPKMMVLANEIHKQLEEAAEKDLTDAGRWIAILSAIEETMEYAEKINFSPPEDRFWWISAEGKERELRNINFSFNKDLIQISSIKEITDELSDLITSQKNTEEKLKLELERMKSSFDEFLKKQTGQMLGIPKQFGGIPIDLSSLVLLFPLLIGQILAVLAVWYTRRLNELITAIEIAEQHDKNNPLVNWIIKKIIGRGNTRLKRVATFIGFTAIAWLWIIWASIQLANWHAIEAIKIIKLSLISGGIMTIGFIYSWRIRERGFNMLLFNTKE